MNFFFILFFILGFFEVICDVILPVQVIDTIDMHDRPKPDASGISPAVFMSIIMYQCSVKEFDDSVLVIYGTKSWTFPAQDVNLTLSYPTDFVKNSREPFDDYLITGFKVHLYVDGTHSRGYINNGGIWQNIISLSFTLSNITTLAYHFWVFGVPKQMTNVIDNLSINNIINRTIC